MKQTIYGWALTVGELKRLLEAHDDSLPVGATWEGLFVPLQPGPNMSIVLPKDSEPLLSFDVDGATRGYVDLTEWVEGFVSGPGVMNSATPKDREE